MNTHKFMVDEIRFHLKKPDVIIFVGWFYDGNTKNHTLTVTLDGRELPLEQLINRGVEINQKYIHSLNEISEEVVGIVNLPKDWKNGHKLVIQSTYKGNPHTDEVCSVAKLKKLENKIRYSVDNVRKTADKVVVNGFCIGSGEIKLSLLDENKQPIPVKCDYFYRKDPERVGPEDENLERMIFTLESKEPVESVFYLELRSEYTAVVERLDKWNHYSKLMKLWTKGKKTVHFFKQNGMKATLTRINERVGHGNTADYGNWLLKYRVTEEELQRQREEQKAFKLRPKFSIAVPLYRTEERFLRELIASVQNQTYDNWELCLADGSGDGGQSLAAIAEEYTKQDARIHYKILEKNYGIAQNMNEAMKMAEGDFVAPVDHDDTLALNALFEFAKAVNENPDIELLYSDEDKIDFEGTQFFEPHFKADFDPDFFLTNNYICHLLAVKRELKSFKEGFLSEYDGSQDFDFILRCCEEATGIYHVPKVLYHWRCHFDSTAANPQSKLYAFEAGRRAVEAHYKRRQIPATVEHAQFYGLYRTRYHWQEQPLVSVLIPCKDQAEDLERCIASVLNSDYTNYEILVIDQDSRKEETRKLYEKLLKEHGNIRILQGDGAKNKTGYYNFGAKAAAGEYLLFMDCRTQMIQSSCLDELLGYGMRNDVGVAGAKLIYEDDTIHHAGIVLGFGQTAGYVFRGKSRYAAGYESRVICAQNYSAVSGDCMLVKRSIFDAVGGMSEEFDDVFYDIDFCLKVREKGMLVVFNPYAELYYYGPKEKGIPLPADKIKGTPAEQLLKKWGDVIAVGDPYYNPNLTLEKLDFSLRA